MFVNFSHDRITTGSDCYYRYSDTAFNMIEHVVKQPYVCRITVHVSANFIFDLLKFFYESSDNWMK